MAGCSSDTTRFGFWGDAAYAPPGYQTAGPQVGPGIKEWSLPPVQKPAQQPYAAPWRTKTADTSAKPTYGPSPWKWADRPPPPKWTGKPLWTDEEPFPWPDPAAKQKASFQGHYTVRRGDTLPRIAARYRITLDELKRVNGIADTSPVKVGTVLAIPAPGGAGDAPPKPALPPRVVQVKPVEAAPPAPKVAAAELPPPPVPVPKAPAKDSGGAGDGKSPPETTGLKFRWPVKGKIISEFGRQPDGSKSEGIKLRVPMGADIRAAEAGRVHYAGDGLKGYGNLILIRHANAWVSTYAHADKMLVRVGDEVKRGQVIGKVGKTGPVDEPQLGFELRKGSVPVDPRAFLAN